MAVPNPNFPEISKPRGAAELMSNFRNSSRTIAVVPNSTEVQVIRSFTNTENLRYLRSNFLQKDFLKTVDVLWDDINEKAHIKGPPIAWVVYPTMEDLLTAYWMEPNDIPLAVIFQAPDPINGPLSYVLYLFR